MNSNKLPTLEEIAMSPEERIAKLKEVETKAKAWSQAKGVIPNRSSEGQAPSTQAILDRDPIKDKEAQERTVSTVGQTTAASTLEEVESKVVSREVSAKEIAIEQGIREKGHWNNWGESEEGSVDEAKKQAAISTIKNS